MAKPVVEARYYNEGSVAKIEVPEDGYVFRDPAKNDQRIFLPKAEFEAQFKAAPQETSVKAKPPAPPSR